MIDFSRRQLARYAVDEMVNKRPVTAISSRIAAALAVSGRQKEVELLLSDIDQELEDRGLLATARVTSAHPLSLKLKSDLVSRLKKMTGVKEVVLQEQADSNVIGGFKVDTAARSWDRTLRRTLTGLKETN